MEFEIRDSLDGIQADAMVMALPEDADRSDPRFSAIANPLFASGDLPLKPFETIIIPGTPRIVFVGIPKAADLEAWRRMAARWIRCAETFSNETLAARPGPPKHRHPAPGWAARH